MSKPRRALALFLGTTLTVALVLSLPGCSRVRLAYDSADLLLINYADGYLGLESEQRGRWEPVLEQGLADHRRNGLPYLAAFFDRAHQVSQAGFPATETACLVRSARDIYRVHARLAAEVAAPLLADLRPPQVRALKARFARDLEEDRSQARRGKAEARERARRYVRAIEDWTGSLGPEQRGLVSDITGRMPDTHQAVLDYRTRKRDRLIALLESGADADAMVQRLRAARIEAQVSKVSAQGKTWYRVLVRHRGGVESALEFKEHLKKNGFTDIVLRSRQPLTSPKN